MKTIERERGGGRKEKERYIEIALFGEKENKRENGRCILVAFTLLGNGI